MKKRLASFVAIVMLVVGMFSLSSGTAQAHNITGFNWTNVDTICSGCSVNQGNLIGAWQAILWAGGGLNKCGSTGIDGHFGSFTSNATKNWQSNHGLTNDGIVGPNTWSAARSILTYISGSGTNQFFDYIGSNHTVHFQYSEPYWSFRAPANSYPLPYYATTHPDIFFTTC